MNQPIAIVSVIIPAYNTANYIAHAIDSALNQTLHNIEVIVVDDASTDNTVEIIQSFCDSRLKLLVNETNLGAGGARNRALRAATGKWIAVLDSDDWYAAERLEKLVHLAQVHQADLIADNLYLIEDGHVCPWGTLIGGSGQIIDSVKQISAADFVKSDIEGRVGLRLGFSKPLFKREFLVQHQIKYDETIKVTQDFWLDMDCFLHRAKFFLIPEAYYYYRSRPGSLVASNKIKRLEDECRAIANFLQHQDYLKENPQLLAALEEKMTETQTWLDYYSVVEPFKQKQLLTGLMAIFAHPIFLKHFTTQLPKIIERRFQLLLSNSKISYQKNMFQV
ncbi:glycosyl transferase family 2 [Stanieria cyanosphaera PCC 7437]|uniref:Glycosyl transferase family 2 n=1 Tax=Stanieria cyanosphaera (strain ATCC 29371 / PCC 7437) TaxID=111780 RepID=K9XXG2_STAC7|nr:glycosyltransferase family 2 protein [Stanieria cyanosphaera]AFZ37213.1 glycosyl transferase family 2 [Stanieria cyanosphaera PCC 7437]